MSAAAILALLFAWATIVATLIAVYQYERAEEYRQEVRRLKRERLDDAVAAGVAGAGAQLVAEVSDRFFDS